jgi:hypothetical protein
VIELLARYRALSVLFVLSMLVLGALLEVRT